MVAYDKFQLSFVNASILCIAKCSLNSLFFFDWIIKQFYGLHNYGRKLSLLINYFLVKSKYNLGQSWLHNVRVILIYIITHHYCFCFKLHLLKTYSTKHKCLLCLQRELWRGRGAEPQSQLFSWSIGSWWCPVGLLALRFLHEHLHGHQLTSQAEPTVIMAPAFIFAFKAL